MTRQIAIALCLTGLGLGPASLIATAQPNAVTSSASQSYASIKDIMDAIIDPSADTLWDAVKTVVDQDGTHDTFPNTPQEWLELRRAAVRIIEGANLLMMPGRQAAPAGVKSEVPGVELEPAEITALIARNRDKFDFFAGELRALGWDALKAAEEHNPALLLEVGGLLQDACERCHKVFWYPNEKLPDAR